jgi:hypothetical protein
MAKSAVNKKDRLFLKKEAAKVVTPEVTRDQPLPVVALVYPRHGKGTLVERFVRVLEADDTHIRGFEIEYEYDEEPGQFKCFDRKKIEGKVALLHLAASVAE